MTVNENVKEALNNAGDNGYDIRLMSVDEIVIDLMTYDADLEKADRVEVTAAVVLWKDGKL